MKNYAILNGSLSEKTLHDLIINKADENYIYTDENEKYLDFNSGLWNVSLGYNSELNQKINERFSEIFRKNIPYIDIFSYSHEIYNESATVIKNFVGSNSFSKVIFANSGSESIELSLKIFNAISAKKKFVSFAESYHGTFYGCMSISGLTRQLVDSHNPDYRNSILLSLPTNDDEEKIFFERLEEVKNYVGALFIEPIIGSGGVKFGSIKFYNDLLKYCNENDILTIFDEIATGFYRTGEKFFFENLDYIPDIICLSKSINNGVLPTGCVLINTKVENALSDKVVEHVSTQNGNILCQVSIIETIKYFENNKKSIKENVTQISKITKSLSETFQVPLISYGAMISIPIKKKNISSVFEKLQSRKILTYRYVTNEDKHGLTLMPPITMDKNIFEKALKYILKVVKTYE